MYYFVYLLAKMGRCPSTLFTFDSWVSHTAWHIHVEPHRTEPAPPEKAPFAGHGPSNRSEELPPATSPSSPPPLHALAARVLRDARPSVPQLPAGGGVHPLPPSLPGAGQAPVPNSTAVPTRPSGPPATPTVPEVRLSSRRHGGSAARSPPAGTARRDVEGLQLPAGPALPPVAPSGRECTARREIRAASGAGAGK